MPFEVPVLDSFNRPAGGPPPSPSWATDALGFSLGQFLVSGNQMAQTAQYAQGYWAAGQFGPDVEACITVTGGYEAVAGAAFGIFLLTAVGASHTGYSAYCDRGSGIAGVYREGPGPAIPIAEGSLSVAHGDTLGIRRRGQQVELWHKPAAGAWTRVFSGTDATFSGPYFVAIYSDGGASGATTFDALRAGTLNLPYDTRVAWSTKPSNAFAFGTSTLGGGDVLTGQFSASFTGPNDDVSDLVRRISIDRGRDSYMEQMRAGRATIVLRDTTGRFNPKNPASPLAGQVLPMRPVRVTCTLAGTTYGLFYGFLRSVEHDPLTYESTLECEDLLMWMSRVTPVIAAGALTTGQAIGLVLDAIGWTDTLMRDLDVGDTLPAGAFTADGSRNALELIQGLLEAERGVCYVSRTGVFVYEDRRARAARTSSATFAGTMSALRPGMDLDRIRNRATVTRDGGSPQSFQDGNSIAAYGAADGDQITTPYLETDVQAASLAAFIVSEQRDPRAPARDLTLFNKTTALYTQILSRELIDRITVSEPKGNTAGDFHIERITHEITDAGKIHRCTWTLAERPAAGTPFILGTSLIGGGHVLTY